MTKFYNYLLIWLVSIGPVNALELGQMQVESFLNEPFSANFTLGHIAADNLGDILLSVGGQDDYQSVGLTRPQFINNIKFEIIPGKDSRHRVNLSTRQLIREPILDVLVKVTEKQSIIQRLYTLMLDPRGHEAALQVSVAGTEMTDGSHRPLANNKKISPISQPPEKLSVKNDSISMIAQNSAMHKKYSVYQIMRAYYLLNKVAFLRGNINFLKSGVTLIVPDENLIAEKTRQQSINFVYRVSKNEVTDKNTTVQHTVPDPGKLKKVAVPTQVPVKQLAVNQNTSLDKENKPKSVLNKLQNELQNDVKSWRNVSQEFASLSSAVASQNDALQRQSAVLFQIDNQLELNNQQLQEFHLRLAALENIMPVMQDNTDSGEAVTGSNAVSGLSNDERLQIQSTLRSAALDSIRKRLDDLETQQSIALAAPAVSSEIPQSPAGKPQQNNVAIQPYSYKNILTWGIALLAILLLLNREFVWRRRLKVLELLAVPKPHEPDQDNVESAVAVEEQPESEPEPVIDEKLEAVVEDQQVVSQDEQTDESPEDSSMSNLKLAENQYDQAISDVRDYQQKFSDEVDIPFKEESDSQTLYTEIDILIAYQLYDEALELVKKARETLHENLNLDIRELQILGYLKSKNLFVDKFDQQKDVLSVEFPEEWKKIEQFYEGLNTVLHFTAVK